MRAREDRRAADASCSTVSAAVQVGPGRHEAPTGSITPKWLAMQISWWQCRVAWVRDAGGFGRWCTIGGSWREDAQCTYDTGLHGLWEGKVVVNDILLSETAAVHLLHGSCKPNLLPVEVEDGVVRADEHIAKDVKRSSRARDAATWSTRQIN